MIEVLSPGLISSIQDLGRRGFAHMGVSQAGAIDGLSLHLANRLVENPGNTPALEIVIPPAKFRFLSDTWIALAGADCVAVLDGKPIRTGWRVQVKAGQELTLTPAVYTGFCTYLAVAGGFDVPQVMGSASTDIKAGYGGIEGRPVRRGEKLKLGKPFYPIKRGVGIMLPEWTNKIHALPGPEYAQFSKAAQEQFWEEPWKVTSSSNRMGFRLQGKALTRDNAKDMLSQGAFAGIVQVPPNGQPIILAAEAQSTAGYPRIAVITKADIWKIGQLHVGKAVQFAPSTPEAAMGALKKLQDYLQKIEFAIVSTRG
jgi:biotin-dependent carboxylase-like uncharacterized protein